MKIIRFVDKWGTKRKGTQAQCANPSCKQKFIRHMSGGLRDKKYCSPTCASLMGRTRKAVTCGFCENPFELEPSKTGITKSGLNFCSRFCKDSAQRMASGNKFRNLRPSHYGTGTSPWVARILAKQTGAQCCDCKEGRGYLLTVNHIDGSRENNKPENLEVVCWNCHAKRHLKLVDGIWQFDFKALTPRDVLNSL